MHWVCDFRALIYTVSEMGARAEEGHSLTSPEKRLSGFGVGNRLKGTRTRTEQENARGALPMVRQAWSAWAGAYSAHTCLLTVRSLQVPDQGVGRLACF